MHLILGVITYNRVSYLKNLLQSFLSTYNKNYSWQLVIADDGSTDSTIEFINDWILKNPTIDTTIIKNNRVYIAGQSNSILKFASKLYFDFGFMVNDDVEFLDSGWDIEYVNAHILSKMDHLVYFDTKYASRKASKLFPKLKHNKMHLKNDQINLNIVAKIPFKLCMGCFWTFTRDIIEKVGYFNTDLFIGSGYSHIEYTLRCCRANFNNQFGLYDIEFPKLKVSCEQNDPTYFTVKDNLNISNNKKILASTINNKKLVYYSPKN